MFWKLHDSSALLFQLWASISDVKELVMVSSLLFASPRMASTPLASARMRVLTASDWKDQINIKGAAISEGLHVQTFRAAKSLKFRC